MSQVPTVTPELLARYKARSAVPQDQSSGNAGQLDPGMLMRYKQRAAASLPAQTAFHEDQDATPALPTMPPRNDRAALVNAGQNMVGLPSVSGAMDSPVDPSMAPAMMPMTGAQPPERGFWNEAAQSFAQAAPRGLPDLIRPIAPDTAAALEQRQAVQVGRPNDPSFLNTTVPQTLGGMAGGLVNPQEAPANVVGGMMGGGAARLAGPLVERVAGIAGPRVAAALQHAIGGSAGMAPLAALQRAGQITPEQWATDPGGAISEILKAGAAAGATGGVIGAASGAMAGRPGSGAQETRLAPTSEQLAPVFAPTLDRVPTDLRPTTAAEMPLVLPIEQIPQVPAEVPAALADPATKPPANAGIPEVSSPSPQNATPKVASATPNVSESRGHTLTDSGPQSEPAPDLTRLQSVIDNPAQAKRPELQSVLEMMGLETTGNTAMLRKRIRAAVEASKSAQESPNAVESSNQGGQGQVQGQEGPAPVENVVGSGKLPARGVQEKGQVLSDGRGPFTKADLESRIRSAYESSPERQALSMESDIASQQGGFDDGSGMFSFPGKLPPEIRDATERNPSLRAVFTVGKKGGKGADYLSELGQDKYMRAAMERLGTGIEAAKEVLRTSQDPEHQFLAAVHDNLPEGRAVPKVSLKPDELPKGSRFTINGEPMRVVEGEQGYTVLKDGGSYPETPVDALTEIPADRGSLKTGTNRGHKADISGARGATVESAGLPREPWQMTRKEFEKGGFYQHSVLRDDAPDIGPDGFRSGIGPNVVLATTGTPTDIMQMRYGTKAGRPVYAVPKSETIDTPNGRKIKDGFKPGSKIIPSRDHQPLHEAVVEQAIREGKPVPPEVLADYPDLKPKAKNETSGVFGQSVTDANTGAQRGFVFETESQPQADPRAREGVDAKIADKYDERATPSMFPPAKTPTTSEAIGKAALDTVARALSAPNPELGFVGSQKAQQAVQLFGTPEGRETLKIHAQGVLGRVGGRSIPKIIAADPVAGEAGVTAAVSKVYAKSLADEAATELGQLVGGGSKVKDRFLTTVGAILTEDNLRGDMARDPANAPRSTLVGPGKFFPDEAAYQAALNSKEFQAAVPVLKKWEAVKDEFASKAGVTNLNAGGLDTGIHWNLKAIRPENPAGPVEATGPKQGNPNNAKIKRDRFNRQRTGLGEYDTNFRNMAENTFLKRVPNASLSDFYAKLEEGGNAVKSSKPVERIKGEPTVAFDIKDGRLIQTVTEDGKTTNFKPGERLYVRRSIADEVKSIAKVDQTMDVGLVGKVQKALTTAQLELGFADSITHSINLTKGLMTAEGVGRNKIAAAIGTFGGPARLFSAVDSITKTAIDGLKDPAKAKARITELSKIGAWRDIQAEDSGIINRVPSKILRAYDRSVRLALDQAFTNLVDAKIENDTPAARREFINGNVGQYEKSLQGTLTRAARTTGLAPFATAMTTFNRLGLRNLTGTPSGGSFAGSSLGGNVALRAAKIANIAGWVATGALVNRMVWGKDIPKTIPFGSVYTGKDKDGKDTYVDLLDMATGVRRGARLVGFAQAIDDATKGKPFNADRAVTEAVNQNVLGYAGPGVRAGIVAATGKEPRLTNADNFRQAAEIAAPNRGVDTLKDVLRNRGRAAGATVLSQLTPDEQAIAAGDGTRSVLLNQIGPFKPRVAPNENSDRAGQMGRLADYTDNLISRARRVPVAQRMAFLERELKNVAPDDQGYVMRQLKMRKVMADRE